MPDEYSYPEVLDLSYEQIDALDVTYAEKQNIKLRKYANRECTGAQREGLIKVLVDVFTNEESAPRNRRATVTRWLNPNPGNGASRRDFYTGTGSKTMLPNSYDSTVVYREGEQAGTPQKRGNEKAKLAIGDRIELRDNFIKGITNRKESSPTAFKKDRAFTNLDGSTQKNRVIQYLRPGGLWNEKLNLKFSINPSDLGFEAEFDDYQEEGRGGQGLRASSFDGLY